MKSNEKGGKRRKDFIQIHAHCFFLSSVEAQMLKTLTSALTFVLVVFKLLDKLKSEEKRLKTTNKNDFIA